MVRGPRRGIAGVACAAAVLAAAFASSGGSAAEPKVRVLLVESGGAVVAIRAGARERLAAGGEPALSPDGTRLAFVRGDGVWVRPLWDGPARRVAAGRSPAWSPDGRLAVAAPDGVRVGGRLVAAGAAEPAWAPDGRLAVVTAEGIVVGGELVVPGGASPAFAPDGRLAYELGGDVHVDGALAATEARDPAWDPAGNLAVVTVAGIAVGGTRVPGSRVGDLAPAWGLAAPQVPELLLPDLDMRAPSGLDVRRSGGRVRLGFVSAADNVGRGPLWIRGSRAGPHARAMRADQLVEAGDRSASVVRGVGTMRFVHDAPHHHWHLLRFQEFELRSAADFALVVRDRKTGFCLRDSYGPARLRSGRVPARFTGNCGQWQTARTLVEMGTSVGYTDRYPAHFHGQSLDLTGVAGGVYVLVHRTNAAGRIREVRLDNNAASLRLRIAWPRGPRALPRVTVLRRCEGSERC